MSNKGQIVKYGITVLLAIWLILSFLFSAQISRYFTSFSPQISEGEASVDYYSGDNTIGYTLYPNEVLSLPIRLEKRLSRIGIYVGEQETRPDKYAFQLEDEYGSVLGKNVVSLEDMAKDEFVYIPSRSAIISEDTYYIKIFSDPSNAGDAPLHLNTSLASAFQTLPFSIEGAESENTLVLDRRYEADNLKGLAYADLFFAGIVAIWWIVAAKGRWKNSVCGFFRKLPWKRINATAITLLIAADILLLFTQKTEHIIQYGNEKSVNYNEFAIPLSKDTVLTQYFQAGEGTVNSFSFLFATYKQTVEDGTVYVELWNESDGSQLYSESIQTETIVDNEYRYFQLDEPLELSGQTLRLQLWAEYASEDRCIAVYANKNHSETMFAAEDGKPQDESLIFDIDRQVGLPRIDLALIITALLLFALVLYVWVFAQFRNRVSQYAVSTVLLSVLFLLPVLSFANYHVVSMNGMTASLNNHKEWSAYRQYSEGELTERLFTETEYDFKGEPLVAYERVELPINGTVSDIKLDYLGNAMARKDYDIQIYWDTGNGYNDAQSYTYKYIHQGGNTLSFLIPCCEPVRSIMLNVGMTSDRFTGASLPDRILPLTCLELNTNVQAVRFFSIKTAVIFICILCCSAIAHLWKYADLDEKLAAFFDRKKISISTIFTMLALVLGISMSFLIPTLQVPDERAHISMLFSDMGNKAAETVLLDTLGDQGLRGVMLNAGQPVDASSYLEASAKRLEDDSFDMHISLRMMRRPGQTLGVFIGQLLNLPAYWILQLGELGALIVYIAVGALTLKVIPYKKNLMMLLMLLPVAMQEAGSLSYDSFNNALAFLTVAYILHLKIRAAKVSWKQLLILGLLSIGLLIGKVIYVLLMGLVFTIPLSKLELKLGGARQITINAAWVKKHRVSVASGLIVGLFICAAGGLLFIETLGYRDVAERLWGYISSFPQLVRLCISTCVVHWRMWLRGMVTALGNYDVPVNEIVTWAGVLSAFLFAVMHHRKLNTQVISEEDRHNCSFSGWDFLVWYGLFATLFFVVLMTMINWGFFIYGIDKSLPYSISMRLLPRIEGVQGRYFYPILPLLFIPIHTKKNWLNFIPAGLYKICYYFLMTVYPISLLLTRYWGIGSR